MDLRSAERRLEYILEQNSRIPERFRTQVQNIQDRRLARRLASEENPDFDVGAEVADDIALANLCRQVGIDVNMDKLSAEATEHNRSKTKGVECIVCVSKISVSDAVLLPCSHVYCRLCISHHFALACKNESSFPPRCCNREVPLLRVQHFLPADVVRKFKEKAVEYRTPGAIRTYCANLRCSTFIDPVLYSRLGDNLAKCPKCSTLTCTRCKSEKHDGECRKDSEFQDVLNLAEKKKWRRCNNCGRLVELAQGCNHIVCHCGAQFCYECGAKWHTCQCAGFQAGNWVAQVRAGNINTGNPWPFVPPRYTNQLQGLEPEQREQLERLRGRLQPELQNHDSSAHPRSGLPPVGNTINWREGSAADRHGAIPPAEQVEYAQGYEFLNDDYRALLADLVNLSAQLRTPVPSNEIPPPPPEFTRNRHENEFQTRDSGRPTRNPQPFTSSNLEDLKRSRQAFGSLREDTSRRFLHETPSPPPLPPPHPGLRRVRREDESHQDVFPRLQQFDERRGWGTRAAGEPAGFHQPWHPNPGEPSRNASPGMADTAGPPDIFQRFPMPPAQGLPSTEIGAAPNNQPYFPGFFSPTRENESGYVSGRSNQQNVGQGHIHPWQMQWGPLGSQTVYHHGLRDNAAQPAAEHNLPPPQPRDLPFAPQHDARWPQNNPLSLQTRLTPQQQQRLARSERLRRLPPAAYDAISPLFRPARVTSEASPALLPLSSAAVNSMSASSTQNRAQRTMPPSAWLGYPEIRSEEQARQEEVSTEGEEIGEEGEEEEEDEEGNDDDDDVEEEEDDDDDVEMTGANEGELRWLQDE